MMKRSKLVYVRIKIFSAIITALSCICIWFSVRSEAGAEIKQPMVIIYTFTPNCRRPDCLPPAPQTDEPAHAAGLGSRNARQSKGIGGGATKRPVTFTRPLLVPY